MSAPVPEPSDRGPGPFDPTDRPTDPTQPMVRVVIAEDEAIIRLDLKEILEEAGFEVVGDTGRGDEAVELARLLDPDLVILDIEMPGLDGIEAARLITDEHLAAVLIVTAFSQRDLVSRATGAGAMAYLVKPYQRSDLLPAVEVALARHRDLMTQTERAEQLERQLENRKLVDRAKGLLIDRHGMGPALEDWKFRGAFDISADGRFIIGTGVGPNSIREGFLVRLDHPFGAVPEPSSAWLIAIGILPLWRLTRRPRRQLA